MAPDSPERLLEKADKKAASASGWFSNPSVKFEEAGDLYQQAANAFKIEKRFKEAGDAHAREAECREKSKEMSEAANAWWNAAKAYGNKELELAIHALSQAVTHMSKAGRFRQAADREKEIGKMYIKLENRRKALESYTRAAEWYEQETATATANSCWKDVADLHAELGDYREAMEAYEKVATNSLASNLTKFAAKQSWFRAVLCALASGDLVLAEELLKKLDSDSASREAKFAHAILAAVKSDNVQEFTACAVEYDEVMSLDSSVTKILLGIKKRFAEEPSLM